MPQFVHAVLEFRVLARTYQFFKLPVFVFYFGIFFFLIQSKVMDKNVKIASSFTDMTVILMLQPLPAAVHAGVVCVVANDDGQETRHLLRRQGGGESSGDQ